MNRIVDKIISSCFVNFYSLHSWCISLQVWRVSRRMRSQNSWRRMKCLRGGEAPRPSCSSHGPSLPSTPWVWVSRSSGDILSHYNQCPVQVLKAKNAFLKALTVRHLTEEDYRRRGEVGHISYQTYRNSTLFHHTFHSTFGFHFWLPPGQMEGNILGLPANFSPGWWLWLLKSLCQEEEECDDDDLVHSSSQWTSSSTSTSTKIQWNTFSTKSSSSSSSSS